MGGRGSRSHGGGGLTVEQAMKQIAESKYHDHILLETGMSPETLSSRSGKVDSQIPEWVLSKNFNSNELFAWHDETSDATIERETEKAVLVSKSTEYGRLSTWVPKSVMKSPEQQKADEERYKQNHIARRQSYEIGRQYNNYLYRTAKERGVKGVRERMRSETLANKINQAGVSVLTREQFMKQPAKKMVKQLKGEDIFNFL